MKATGYVQIVPSRRANGTVKELRILKVTKTYPRIPEPGALVLELSLDIDSSVFEPVALDIEIDQTNEVLEAAVTPIPFPHQDDTDEDEGE